VLKKILHWLEIKRTPCIEQGVFKSFYVSIGGFSSQMRACRLATAIQETFDLPEECVRVKKIFVKPVLRSDGINLDKAE
jgi:hypothetical protein